MSAIFSTHKLIRGNATKTGIISNTNHRFVFSLSIRHLDYRAVRKQPSQIPLTRDVIRERMIVDPDRMPNIPAVCPHWQDRPHGNLKFCKRIQLAPILNHLKFHV